MGRKEYVWNLREEAPDGNLEYKKLLFIDCLPDSETKRATALVVNNKISFEDLVAKYRVPAQHLVPSFQAEAEWRGFMPESRKWSDIDHWFHDWLQLAAEVKNLTPELMKEQFLRAMITLHPTIVTFFHEQEFVGQSYSLQEMWTIVVHVASESGLRTAQIFV